MGSHELNARTNTVEKESVQLEAPAVGAPQRALAALNNKRKQNALADAAGGHPEEWSCEGQFYPWYYDAGSWVWVGAPADAVPDDLPPKPVAQEDPASNNVVVVLLLLLLLSLLLLLMLLFALLLLLLGPTPPEIPPVLMQRRPAVDPRSFSDSRSGLLSTLVSFHYFRSVV
jgi:hypothetical protein